MEKILAQVDKDLVLYYSTLFTSQDKKGNEFKNIFLNSLLSYYFGNKQFFSNPPISLKKHFLCFDKSFISISLNELNEQFFTFFYQANNRSKKHEAEFIITNLLLKLRDKSVNRIKVDEHKGVVFLKANRVVKF